MSIYTAMRAGVSGLQANAAQMAVISDNIANVNTIGFKRGGTDFKAVLNSQGGGPGYNAGGVTTSTRRMVDLQGSIEQASSPTNLAISGNGFFIVTNDPNSARNGGGLFTRAGAFSLDSQGRLVNAQGYYLLGTPVDPSAPNATAPSTLAALEPIDLSNVGARAIATTNVAINANLDSRSTVYAGPPAYAAGKMSVATTDPTYVRPTLERSVEVFDSLGAVRTLTLAFLKTDTPTNTWAAEIYYADPTSGTRTNLAQGTIQFGTNGEIQTITSAAPTDLEDFTIDWTTAGPPVAGTGAADQPLKFDFMTGLKQYAISSALNSATADGSPPGNLTGVNVSSGGILTAQFSNGRSEPLYLIPVATFLNPNGLAAEPGNAFRQSIDSGLVTINSAGTGAAGKFQSSALEASNVDLGTEFTDMIVTQRAYSASSRVITTADEMLDELIRIKR
ncbi:MAG: flagellar hook protein FlgE [Alphaproteobacteria bacterium]|jgi:flagellar hook protein FlgE|nr:flagellar hook protein FlgE [Alphaproteobacteria bacterium]